MGTASRSVRPEPVGPAGGVALVDWWVESSDALRPHYNPAIEILTVCTGNVCRSPMSQYILQRDLDRRGVEATVTSAGLLRAGMPAADEVIELLDARGLDARGHLSRPIDPDMLAATDLVLGMAREHVREVVLMRPELFGRTFTLRELVRLGREHGPRRPGESLADWLARLGADRQPSDVLGASQVDDIADPIGHRFGVFKKTAVEIDDLTAELVAMAWPGDPG